MIADPRFIDLDHLTHRLLVTHRLLLQCMKKPSILKVRKISDVIYELYLAVEDIDHSRTRTKSPQTNGICERFHKTVLNEFYRIAFRKKVYRSIDELQTDLDSRITEYNEVRPHQGRRWCLGKTRCRPSWMLSR